MGIREEIAVQEAAASRGGRPFHHNHRGPPSEAGGANLAPACRAKHERISLKRLHSLRNQLFCGFKSFTSSSDQPDDETRSRAPAQAPTPAPTPAPAPSTPTKQHPLEHGLSEVSKIGRPKNEELRGKLQRDAKQTDSSSRMMIVDQRNASLGHCQLGGGGAGRDGDGLWTKSNDNSKSSSRSSLNNNNNNNRPQLVAASLCEGGHLAVLLANNHQSSSDSDHPATQAASSPHGCSSKRASFRRLTGRGSSAARQSTSEASGAERDAPERMIRLIKQLDRMTKSLEQDNQEAAAVADEGDIFYLENSWTDFVRLGTEEDQETKDPMTTGDSADSLEGKQTARSNLRTQQDAIWELLTSEVFYLKRLQVILGIFLETLVRLQKNSLLLEIEPVNLVGNIEEVYLANYAFWTKSLLPMLMRSRLSGCPLDPGTMKDVFARIQCLFCPYQKYCLEHTSCLDYLRDLNKSNQYFKVYLAWCESQKDCERLRLMDLLAKPMQRLTKYPLLLKAIYRRTDHPRQLEDLNKMVIQIISMERFVLNVDLRLRDRDEMEQLRSTANRIESFDTGSSDYYCDEVSRIIMQYCRAFHLCRPLFECPYGCHRRLIFDSSQLLASNHLGQLKFKDSQVSSGKLDVVLLLFTDQLVVCRQATTTKWYASSASQNAQSERSPIRNLKSSVYNKSFRSSRHRNSTKSSSSKQPTKHANWIKSRSASGNHLVDLLILANDRTQSTIAPNDVHLTSSKTKPPGAHNRTVSNQQRASFHLSSSSLTGNVARQHFVVSKSAEGSRSGESFGQSPSKTQATASSQSSRLRAIRSPYPIDRLVMHELNDGHRIFCCQLNDSGTIAASFILHIGSTASAETNRGSTKGDHQNQQPREAAGQHLAAVEPGRPETQSSMYHLSPNSGLSRAFTRLGQQAQISPARRLINLIEQAQAQYKAAAHFHGIPLAPIVLSATNNEISLGPSKVNNSPLRREKFATSSSPNKTSSSMSRSSELLDLCHLSTKAAHSACAAFGKGDNHSPAGVALQASDNAKAILEQEQAMLLKHEKYDELQASKIAYTPANRQHPSNPLDPTATGSFVSPLLSVSIDDSRLMLHVPDAISQNSVFEADEQERAMRTDRLGPKSADQIGQQPDTPKAVHLSEDRSANIMKPADRDQTFEGRRGQSWSSCSANRRPLVSMSGSDIESTASDLSPSLGRCLMNLEQESLRSAHLDSFKRINYRRHVNHLRRQNDIVSFSHDQPESLFGKSLQSSGQACGEPSSSVDELDPQLVSSSIYGNTNNTPSFESPPITEPGLAQHRGYLSLARRIMQEHNSTSQATTMDQTSITLNDNQLDSLDSDENGPHSRAVSIELGNLRSRLTSSARARSTVGDGARQFSGDQNDYHLKTTKISDMRRDLREKADLFDRGQIFLKIPPRIQKVDTTGDDRTEGSIQFEDSLDCIQAEEISCEHDAYRCTIPPSNSLKPERLDQVSVPVLNITSADSHSFKQDSGGLDSGSGTQNKIASTHLRACVGDAMNETKVHRTCLNENLQPLEDPDTPTHEQQTAVAIDDGRIGYTNQPDGFDISQVSAGARSSPSKATKYLDDDCGDNGRDEAHSVHSQEQLRSYSPRDRERARSIHEDNLLGLNCIHKVFHQDERFEDACGRAYLGFYEKLDLHLRQNCCVVGCHGHAVTNTILGDCKGIDQLVTARPYTTKAGRHSPAESESRTSRRVKSLRTLTNGILGSLLRATSSCSIYSKK